MSTALRQARALAGRSVREIVRQPQVIVSSTTFPLVLVALNEAAMGRATNLAGFPRVDSLVDFLLPTAMVQGIMIASLYGGSELAGDIQDGFFDRLLASPVSRVSILVGRLAGAAALGAFQATVFVVVLVAFGATVKGGVAAVAVLLLVAVLLAVAVGGFAATIALRTGSAEAVDGSFPLIFITLFTSSAFFPRSLMKGWFQDVATYNPLSWIVEGLRELVTVRFEPTAVAQAVGVTAGLAVLFVGLATRTLRWRIRTAGGT